MAHGPDFCMHSVSAGGWLVSAVLFILFRPYSYGLEWVRREIIRYKLIPRAIAYYTGEAAEDDEGDDEEDYDDEDEEDEEARTLSLLKASTASYGVEHAWDWRRSFHEY